MAFQAGGLVKLTQSHSAARERLCLSPGGQSGFYQAAAALPHKGQMVTVVPAVRGQ